MAAFPYLGHYVAGEVSDDPQCYGRLLAQTNK